MSIFGISPFRLPLKSVAVVVAAASSACCDAGPSAGLDGSDLTGAPIELREFDLTPGCFDDDPPPEREGLSDTEYQLRAASRAMREFRMSYILQAILLLTEPIRLDPTARQWRLPKGDDGLIEGEVLAEGTDWSVIRMVATGIPDDVNGPNLAVTIDVTPHETVYDFGDAKLQIRDDTFNLDDFVRGCDAERGISYELRPVSDASGARVIEPWCWPMSGWPNGDDPETLASARLQCLQLIEANRF